MEPGALALESALPAPFLLVVAGIFGALWGSFFNVVIARVPLGQSVVRPGSHCFACNAPVRAYDNIPILSYFLLRGRCRACGAGFSPRYALVEALVAGLSVLLAWRFLLGDEALPFAIRLARYAYGFAFMGVLVVLSFIDLDTKSLPDVITKPAVLLFFVASFGLGDTGVGWKERLIGIVGGYSVIWLISTGYYYATGREGLGLGDAKLLAVIGAALGWQALPMVIFAASFVGVVVSVPLLLIAQRRDRKLAPAAAAPVAAAGEVADGREPGEPDEPPAGIRRAEVPFGPFLALAALVYLYAGPELWAAFLLRLGGGAEL